MNWRFVSLALPLSLSLIAGGAMAAPSVKVGTLTVIKEGIDAAVEGQLKGASNLAKFQLEKGTDEDLAKLCALFPNMKELQIKSGAKITNLAPLAALKSLTRLEVRDSSATDMTPLSGLTSLTSVTVESAMADPDVYRDPERAKALALDHTQARALLDRLYEDWTEASEASEEVK